MSPESLRSLRESRNLTREELAQKLGCSASAIVQWEHNKREIPAWVEEKMLQSVELKFPITELQEMMDLARDSGMSFESLLQESISELLRKRRAEKSSAPTVNFGATQTTAKIVHLPKPSVASESSDIAAESATGTGPKIRTSPTYGSSLRPRKPKE